ncbi:MAG: hypothetical protein IJP26_03275 [Clostridia bacterium]|nr:hypothetical protein [Clostridia bacterium]
MDIFKIFALCIVAAFVGVIFLEYKKEYATVITVVVGCGLIIAVSVAIINPLMQLFSELKTAGVNQQYFFIALKTVALGYITQFVADTCRDFGFSAIASKAELAGKAAIFLLCVPLIKDLFNVISGIL